MDAHLSRTESWTLLSLCLAFLAGLGQTLSGNGAPLVASIAFSGLAYAMTYAMIQWLGPTFMKAGLKGKDMGKLKKNEMCVVCHVAVTELWMRLIRI